MKKDKETTGRSHWQQWRQSPTFFRNFFGYSIIIVILILSIFILVYRYINKKAEPNNFIIPNSIPMPLPSPPATPVPAPTPPLAPLPAPEPLSLENRITIQNDRLTNLENSFNQQQLTFRNCHQLVALEILQEILEGHLPVNTLTLYLQKQKEPWATNILNRLSPVKEGKTYDQLQVLLILPPSSQPLSRWQHIKNIIKSFVSIRRLDREGQYTVAKLSDIQTALRTHNIQRALDAFAKLSPEEQAHLSSWKQEAQDRLTLETIKQTMLLELSES
jgi:hypothetical protein